MIVLVSKRKFNDCFVMIYLNLQRFCGFFRKWSTNSRYIFCSSIELVMEKVILIHQERWKQIHTISKNLLTNCNLVQSFMFWACHLELTQFTVASNTFLIGNLYLSIELSLKKIIKKLKDYLRIVLLLIGYQYFKAYR